MTLEEKILSLLERYQTYGDGLLWTTKMISEALDEPRYPVGVRIERLINEGKITRDEDGEIHLVYKKNKKSSRPVVRPTHNIQKKESKK